MSVPTHHTHPEDHSSDPAHNDEEGSDWADEGGALQDGPASPSAFSHAHEDDSSAD